MRRIHLIHRLAVPLLALVLSVPARAAAPVDPSLLAGLKARALGPAAMSGRVTCIEGTAAAPGTLYVGAANGGVWKTTNDGLTWNPVFDDQKVASIGALAVSAQHPDVVWAGTGEANVRNSVSVGRGVYRSLDGGRTWTHLGLEKTEHISRIVLHPGDPDVAWVAALGQLWGENAERGVFKTEDGGRTWQKVLYVDERTGAADLVIDPSHPGRLFAALWDHRRQPWTFRSGGPGSGLYATVDGGTTWKRLTEDDGLPAGDLGRIGVAISRSNPEVVYALVEAAKSALVRSEDGGRTWRTVNDDPRTAGRPFYYADLRVDPAWPHRVYNIATRLSVSNDGGKTFETVDTRTHGDYHALWIDPADPRHLVAGNDGGLAISRDRGQTWHFPPNLPLAQYYHVAVDGEIPYNIYGGLQDNGSWRGPSRSPDGLGVRNAQWAKVVGGDGFETLPDPQDAQRGYALSQGGDLARWDLRTGEIKSIQPAQPQEGTHEKLRFNWNAGLAVDPFTPGTIYLGSQYVHKSTDRGDSWTIVSPDLTTDNPEWQKQAESGGLTPDVTGAENFTTILAIAPSPLERGVLWVGTDDGRLHVTRDGGATWESVEKNLPAGVPVHTWVAHIRPSRFAAASAFVVLDNHRRSDGTTYVYRTDDWGRTWKSLATRDLDGWALSIEQDPADPDLLFLGTSFGLYVSTDAGKRWLRWTHGLPTTEVADVVVHPREHDLVIATHGRGLYVLDDVTPLRHLTAEALGEPLHLYGSTPARLALREIVYGNARAGAGDFRGEDPPHGVRLTYSLSLPGLPPAGRVLDKEKEPHVEIRIEDASGRLIRKLEGPARSGLNRTAWDLGREAFPAPPGDGRGRPQTQSGPQVPPGTYRVTVKRETHEAQGTVEVLPPPSVHNTAEDWQARETLFERIRIVQKELVAGIDRINAARADLDWIQKKLDAAAKERGDGATAPADDPQSDLKKAMKALRTQLDTAEKTIYIPPGTKGILDESGTAFAQVQGVRFSLASSWDPPNATQRAGLDDAEATARAALAGLARLWSEDVAAFRRQVEEARIELLPLP